MMVLHPMLGLRKISSYGCQTRGIFTVKSTYQHTPEFLNASTISDTQWKGLWKIKTPERIKFLLWRLATNALPTRDNRRHRIHITDTSCNLCGRNSETSCHLFWSCPVARALWFCSCWALKPEEHHIQSTEEIIKFVLVPPQASNTDSQQWFVTSTMAFVIDEILCLRNSSLHNGNQPNIQKSSLRIRDRTLEFSLISQGNSQTLCPLINPCWTPIPTRLDKGKYGCCRINIFDSPSRYCKRPCWQSDTCTDQDAQALFPSPN